MNSSVYWLVSTMYEIVHVEKYVRIDELVHKLIRELERHLSAEIRHFAQEKNDTELYLIGNLGVLGIKKLESFEIKGFFVTEATAEKFRAALARALKHALPKEIKEEMLNNLVVVETGAELTLEG